MIASYERIGTLASSTDVNSAVDEVEDRYVALARRSVRCTACLSLEVRDEYRKDYDPGRGGFGKRFDPATEVPKGGPM